MMLRFVLTSGECHDSFAVKITAIARYAEAYQGFSGIGDLNFHSRLYSVHRMETATKTVRIQLSLSTLR